MRALALLLLTGCGLATDEGEGDCPVTRQCRQNQLVQCGPDGGVVAEPCPEDTRCAADSPVPQCVPVRALPCDAADPTNETQCQDGLQVRCDPEAAYFVTRRCPDAGICVGDEGKCRAIDAVRCSPNRWSPLCLEGERVVCDGARLTVEGPCSGG